VEAGSNKRRGATDSKEEKEKKKRKKDLFLEIIFENKKLFFLFLIFILNLFLAYFSISGTEKLIDVIK